MPTFDEDVVALRCDVETVFDKISLCREMLIAGMSAQDGLGDVLGFLEVCQGRMPALVRSGGEGLLSEDLFARVLQLNDALTSTLDAEKNGTVFDLPKLEAHVHAAKSGAATSSSGSSGSSGSKGGGGKISASTLKLNTTNDLLDFGDAAPNGNGNGNGRTGGGKMLSSARSKPGAGQKSGIGAGAGARAEGGEGGRGGNGAMCSMQSMSNEIDLLGMNSPTAAGRDTSGGNDLLDDIFASPFHEDNGGGGGKFPPAPKSAQASTTFLPPPPPGSLSQARPAPKSLAAPAPAAAAARVAAPAQSQEEDFDEFIRSLQSGPSSASSTSTSSSTNPMSGNLIDDL